jgi:PHD/YefM family antitoxin component YafN of YafNO toxin-antitoxin module
MTTIQINENTKIGKNIIEMLKVLAVAEKEKSIKFLDETGYLMASPANKEALIDGIKQVENGQVGKTIKTNDLWK